MLEITLGKHYNVKELKVILTSPNIKIKLVERYINVRGTLGKHYNKVRGTLEGHYSIKRYSNIPQTLK